MSDQPIDAGSLERIEATYPGGFLIWNIKHSFREYVDAISDGETVWMGGAGRLERDQITFAAVRPSDRGAGSFAFEGCVRFTGYRNTLHVVIGSPTLNFGPDDITLSVETDAAQSGRRVTLAAHPAVSAAPGSQGGLFSLPIPTLTAEGAALLGGVYPAGERLAPLVIRLPPTIEVN